MTHRETSQINHSNLFNPIKEILIENFQSHKITEIFPAGPGQLTVIVGQSRQGKTAIFRALRWLFYNAPDGADFIRWGCTFARVTVEYADGTQVIRYRTSGGINRYIIRKSDSKGQMQEQVYEGFGRGAVPLEVQQITGVSPVEIGEGLSLNLNLAEQLDGPFLGNKSVSSTSRAKVLGKLAGTEEVDLAAKTLGTDLFRWKRDQEAHEKAVRETGEQLKGYDYLPEFKANMDKLSVIRNQVKADMERREKLNTLNAEIRENFRNIVHHKIIIDKLSTAINKTLFLLVSIGTNIVLKDQLYTILADYILNLGALEAVQAVIKRTDNLPQAEAFIRATEGQEARQRQVDTLRGKWNYLAEDECRVDAIIGQTAGIHQAAEIAQSMEAQVVNKGQAETIVTQWNKMVYDRCQVETILRNTEGVYAAETLADLAQRDIAQLDSLFSIYRQFGGVKTNIWQTEWTLNETEGIPLADSLMTELHSSMERKSKLAMLYGKWEQSKEDMAVVDRQMERTKGIEGAGALVSTTESDVEKNKKLSDLIWKLDGNKKQIMTESILAENAGEEVDKLQTEYFEVLKRAGKCPLCNSEISQEKVREII